MTRDDWLVSAMEALRTQGIGGVRVLALARSLGVTRGSFYWHFQDRQDLLDAMLDWWDREMTDTVIRHVNGVQGDGRKRILSLAGFILLKDKTRYDMAIRSWAQGNRKVASALRRVMQKRLEYVSGLFREVGFPPAKARSCGILLAVYLMSEGIVLMDETIKSRLRLLNRQIQTLTAAE